MNRRAGTLLVVLLTTTQGAAAAPAPAPASTAEEALYLQRLEQRNRTQADFETYDTLAPVRGVARFRPLPTVAAGSGTTETSALAAARSYAAAHASSSLLVWHAGRAEQAAYFDGLRPDETILSRSLAKPLAAVAIGRAIALGKVRSLDQPVAEILGEWRDDPVRRRILVRHLLGMRAGFLPQTYATEPQDILNRSFLHPRHDEIILREYPVVDEPGTPDMPWYGLGVYVAGPYTQQRGWASPVRTRREQQVWHSEPYLAQDLFLFDGNGNQVMYVVPSQRLVILRTGKSPPRQGAAGEWDDSFLPNAIVRGVRRAPGEPASEPQARPSEPTSQTRATAQAPSRSMP